jgi:hypothetical protein
VWAITLWLSADRVLAIRSFVALVRGNPWLGALSLHRGKVSHPNLRGKPRCVSYVCQRKLHI